MASSEMYSEDMDANPRGKPRLRLNMKRVAEVDVDTIHHDAARFSGSTKSADEFKRAVLNTNWIINKRSDGKLKS